MNAPRLEIDLNKIEYNARILIERLDLLGVSVTGVTKAVLGSVEITRALLRAGIKNLGDSRIENIKKIRRSHLNIPTTLIRSPMKSQVDQVVAFADISFNTEIDVINSLSLAAVKSGGIHGIVLMVELGDLREGIMPKDLKPIVKQCLEMPGITVRGIGANLACRNGVSPDHINMSKLSELAESIESSLGIHLDIVSGGNSANLNWVFGSQGPGKINNLRLGESWLLGCETLNRKQIEGLYTDAFTLVVEVIESKTKPSIPWGTLAENAFGQHKISEDCGDVEQAILAIGRQDVDPQGLYPQIDIQILDASSDHLIIQSNLPIPMGTEIKFQINYSALLRAMTSPFVEKVFYAS